MANAESLKKTLQSCFPDDWIRKTAKDTKLVRRRGKIDIVAFFWNLVLGFGTGTNRSLAELRRSFEISTGVDLVPSSFYDRFTPALCKFLKTAVSHVCQNLSGPAFELQGKLGGFVDLVVADCTVITLHEMLSGTYKACRTNHSKAALKVHMVMSVLAAGPKCIQVLSERSKEVQKFKVGPWIQNRLLLIDLGYYCFGLFERIARNGGFFVSRVKDNANFKVVSANRRWRGRSRSLVGKTLKEFLPHLKREVLDVTVEVTVTKRTYLGRRNKVKERLRLVGVRNDETKAYHLYLTNVPVDRLSPQDIARTYAARWEVEMLFKELKSHYNLDEVPSTKRHIVESLIYVAILTLTVSRALLFALRRRAKVLPERTPERRWAATFKTIVAKLLAMMMNPNTPKSHWRKLEKFLCHEFIDPNVKRSRNLSGVGA